MPDSGRNIVIEMLAGFFSGLKSALKWVLIGAGIGAVILGSAGAVFLGFEGAIFGAAAGAVIGGFVVLWLYSEA